MTPDGDGRRVVLAPLAFAAARGSTRSHLALVRDGMNAVVNEPRGTAYAARITDPAYAMGGKSGTSQVRRITQYERDHGVRKASQVPWRERDHALFVALRAGSGAALCLRRRRRAWRRGGRRRLGGRGADLPRRAARSAAPRPGACRAEAGGGGRNRPRPADAGNRGGGARRAMTNPGLGIGRRELTLADKFRGIQWGLLLLLGLIAGIGFAMLYSAANGEVEPVGVAPDDPFRGRAGRRDRGRGDRRRHTGSAPLTGFTRRRCCWSSRSICAASSAWGRSAGSISARFSCSRPK